MNRQYKRFILITIFMLSLLLAGCSDSRPPERYAYAHGFAIDYKDGEYIIYLQLLNLGTLAKIESSAPQETTAEVGRAKGSDVTDAIFNLYRSTQEEIYWGNLSFIVMTERLLKEKGMKPVVDMWSRFPETRYHIYFYAADNELEKILLSKPVMDVSKVLNRLADPQNNYDQSSFIPFVDLRKLLLALNEPSHLGVLPFVSVSDERWKTDKEPRPLIEFNGLTLYDRDERLLGTLTGKAIEGYRWLDKNFKRDVLTVQKKEKTVASLIINESKAKITPVKEKDRVHFKVMIKIKASVSELSKDVSISNLEDEAAKTIKEQVLFTYREALRLNADIYRLSEKLYRDDVKTWKLYTKDGRLDLQEDSIDVHVDVLIKETGRDHLKRSLED